LKDQNKKRFKLIDFERDGKGIGKNKKMSESGLNRFFVTYKDNIGKLMYVNMYMILGNFPIFFLIAVLAGYTKYSVFLPSADIFQNLSGIFMFKDPTPFSMTLYALEGLPTAVSINSTLSYVFIGISLLTLFTFGLVNVGTAYLLRNIAKGEPVFVWADFWYAIKRNWKQALPFGIIDGIVNALLFYNIYLTIGSGGDFLGNMMFWANVILVILYFFMRGYIYVQMVTFKLSVFKIVKNSLSFALLGIKRNILAFLGALVAIILELTLLFGLKGILISGAVIFPLTIMFSSLAYMKVYAAYFKIKEIIIDPYYKEHPELMPVLQSSEDEEEAIMSDDVTAKERLEEIRRRNGMSYDD